MDRRHARGHGEDRLREQRVRLAQEAARIMTEHGVRDYSLAKRKAAERLGILDEEALPRNAEIEAALRERHRLFQHQAQPGWLRARRETAVAAMRFFAAFEPRLVGSVLEGTADEHSAVSLHVFSDDPHAVRHFLERHRIPYDERTRRLRHDRERGEEFPVYVFSADGITIDLTVMPRDGLRQAPLDRVDSRPMRRASLAAVIALLDDGDPKNQSRSANGM